MYGLNGLGSANQLAVDMPDQTVKIFYGITSELGAALTAGGKPQRPYNFASYNVQSPQWGLAPNGYYTVSQFMGGFLLDGCPLNVIFGQGWISGQQEALTSHGITCGAPAMSPTAPVSSAGPIPGSTTVNQATFSSGPNYANTNPTQVIISPGQGTVAPVANAPGQPILPTGPTGPAGPTGPVSYVMPGEPHPAGGSDLGAALPILAGITIVAFLLGRKRG